MRAVMNRIMDLRVSYKLQNVLDRVRNYQLLKKELYSSSLLIG